MRKEELENLMFTRYIECKKKAANNQPYEFVKIDDRTDTARYTEKTTLTKSYKRLESMESPNRPHSEGSRHIL